MGNIEATLQALQARLNDDPVRIHRGRYLDLEFLLQIAENSHFLRIQQGRLTQITPAPQLLRPWTFKISIEAEAWQKFCQPMPRPGYHDIFAMTKQGVAMIEGEIHPFMANLRFFQELLALARPEPVEAVHGD